MDFADLLYFSNYRLKTINKDILRPNLNNELLFIKSGNGKLFYENEEYELKPNIIITIKADVIYRIECYSEIEYICVGFKGGNLLQNISYIQDGGTFTISALLAIMKKEFESKNFKRRNVMNCLLNTILILTYRLSGYTDDKKDVEKDNFNFILNYMKAKSNFGIDMDEIAKMSGLSYHRFRHKFKELTEISPQQYIIKQRISFAKKLLENTVYNTTSIAIASGFHSVPQFITCFSKQEGITPVKYRRNCLRKSR